MKEITVICNMCGKEIDIKDLECNKFSINQQIGYGSVHDGDFLDLDLCSTCLDRLITYLIETCKIEPLQLTY